MAGGYTAPSPQNYVLGRGFLTFKQASDAAPVALGNAPKIIYTPDVPVLPHFSVMQGEKVQDFSTIIQKGGKIAMDLEEQTYYNLSLFWLGSVNTSAGVRVGIFDLPEQIAGQLIFWPTNNVGPRWKRTFTNILISPTGEFDAISDTYQAMRISGAHVIDQNQLFGYSDLLPDVSTIPPTNMVPPFITGDFNVFDVPTYAQVGEELTANIGAWSGQSSFTYQWQAGANEPGLANISGATNQNFTPTTAQLNMVLACIVTGINNQGDTPVTTAVTAYVVHA
jgi:hypothetical protein